MCCRSCETTQLKQTLLQQRSADVQALACTILYMFTQIWPFEDMTSVQIGDAVQAGQIPAIPDSLPLDLQRMLRQCFTSSTSRSAAALMALKLQVTFATAANLRVCIELFACHCD